MTALIFSYYYLNELAYDKLTTMVKKENRSALEFNEKLGFLVTGQDEQFVYLESTLKDFLDANF